MKSKKIFILVGIVAAAVLILGFAFSKLNQRDLEPVETAALQTFGVGTEEFSLKRGDGLNVNAWNGPEASYNSESLSEFPVIYGGITVGSGYAEVLDKFGIEKDYAMVDMEVPYEPEDGTTDIVRALYEDAGIFEGKYLDLSITFGYAAVDGEWEMIKYRDLEKYQEKNRELLIFYIDFNGMSDESVGVGEVIAFSVLHH